MQLLIVVMEASIRPSLLRDIMCAVYQISVLLCKAVQSNQLIFICLGVIILHIIVCTVIHNCSSSGSLFFASLRQNN